MTSVASQVNASINSHRDAKASASANGKDRNGSSPFEEMLDSAVAAEDPAPPTKDAPPAKASKGSAATEGNTKPANDAPVSDDAPPAQASDLERDEAARGENAEDIEAKLAALLRKALTADTADSVPPQQPEAVEEAAPAEKPIAEIGLAAFLEAMASATTPQAEAEDAKDEARKAEGDAKGDVDAVASVVAAPVKADAVVAAVVPVTVESVADPAAQSGDAIRAAPAKMIPAVDAQTAPAPVQQAATPQQPQQPDEAAAADLAADALSAQAEAPKTHADAHKHRAEMNAPHSEAPKLQPAVAGASKADAAPAEPKPAAPHPSDVAHRHGETAESKPAKASVSPAEAPAPAKPVDAPQTLQALPQITAPSLAPIQSPSVAKDMTPVATVPIEGVVVEIAAKASEGMKSFEIRLDPPELGRIHVRLEVDRNGELTSRVTADRQDTLDLLRRDAPQLERALNDAGVRTSNNGLQFSLRDQGQQQQQQQQALPNAARLIVPDESLAAELTQRGYYRPASSAGGIDIRV